MSRTNRTARSGPSGYQITYAVLRETLRSTLRDGMEPGAGTADSIQYRASAALYALLAAHQVDRRGRCRSCRRRGVLLARWSRCRIYVNASYWLRHPGQAVLHSHLVRELNQDTSWPSHGGQGSPDRCARNTNVLLAIEPTQTPAIPFNRPVAPPPGTAGLRSRRGRGGRRPPVPPWPTTRGIPPWQAARDTHVDLGPSTSPRRVGRWP